MYFPFEQEIILENEAALLRPLVPEDAQNLLKVATEDKDLLQYSPAPVYTAELLRDYIDTALAERQNKKRYTFSIFDKIKQEYAGSTSFLNISLADARLEIGATWIGKKFQGTYLNRNCKYLMLQYAFDELGALRTELKTDERNMASRKAIEKIGGVQEGILRSHTLLYTGHRRNTVYYSILKAEWEGMRDHFLTGE